jgi:hypothetical protein
MRWPDIIVIVDDSARAEELRNLLEHPDEWIGNVRANLPTDVLRTQSDDIEELENLIRSMDQRLIGAMRDQRSGLAQTIISCHVRDESDVERAITALRQPGTAIAFVDFDYAASPAFPLIKRLYSELCNAPWTAADPLDSSIGGRLFSSVFGDTDKTPVRVLCPATRAFPADSALKKRKSITDHFNVGEGIPSQMRAVLAATAFWVRLSSGCPLDDIWPRTKLWFGDRSLGPAYPSMEYFPHDLAPLDDAQIQSYRTSVHACFGLQIPWQDFDSINLIHESLKRMCGQYFQGTGDPKDAKYNLSIGSALLIAAMANTDAQAAGTQDDPLLVKVWKKYKTLRGHDGLKARLFSSQNPTQARYAATSLYWLFRFMFTVDSNHSGRFTGVGLSAGGQLLRLQFDGWDVAHLSTVVRQRLTAPGFLELAFEGQQPDHWDVYQAAAGVFVASLTNTDGLGGLSGVRLEKKAASASMTLELFSAEAGWPNSIPEDRSDDHK